MPHSLKLPFRTISRSAQETRALGFRLGQSLDQPIALQLHGDLGSGKTCFVQGLARGLQVPDGYDITSPTYTLINEYPGRMALVHADLYRMAQGVDTEALGLEEIFERPAVVAIEWPQRLGADQWPSRCLAVRIVIQPDDSRLIEIFACGLEKNNLIWE